MKVVRFIYNENIHRYLALGQIASLLQCCYFRGKELGYEKVIVDWYPLVTYPNWDNEGNYKGIIRKPENGYLPMYICNKNDRSISNASIFDMTKPDVLFEGSEPILFDGNTQTCHYTYMNKYFKEHREHPIFKISKSLPDKPYILFHFRKSEQERQKIRNTPVDDWVKTFDLLKEKYKDKVYFYKIGEQSPIDEKFDIVFDYFPNNIIDLYKLMNNSSLYICSPSGPLCLAFVLGIPALGFNNPIFAKDYVSERWINRYGNTAYDWVEKDKFLLIDKYEESVIDEYTSKAIRV